MEIKIKEYGGISVVHIIGRLDTGTSPDAETAMNQLLDSNCRKVVINLAETEWISSSGLRVLLVTAKKLSASRGKLKICQPNQVVREILDISGFSTILDVVENEQDAVGEMGD